MAFQFLDRARQAITTGGSGNLVLGGALALYQTFQQAGITAGDTFPYCIIDGNAWEIGVATMVSLTGSGTISRTVTKTSNQNTTPLNVSTKANVTATYRAEDLSEVSRLDQLTDVSIDEATLTDGYGLVWSVADGAWVAAPGGSGGSTTLAGLTDVQLTSLGPNNALVYNGTKWANDALAAVATSNQYSDLSGKPSLATVATTGAYSDLTGKPTIPTNGSFNLSSLGDVLLTSLSTNQSLKWDGAHWVNYTPSGGGGSTSITIELAGTSVGTGIDTLNFSTNTSVAISGTTATITATGGGGGGGGPGGTPPTFVQFASGHVTSGSIPSVTFGAAPTNGNMLIAVGWSDSTAPSANTGWTLFANPAGSGTWYNYMAYKIAGASESTTQTPFSPGGSSNASVGVWEISGQASSNPVLVQVTNNGGPTTIVANTPAFGAGASTLWVGAIISNSASYSFTSVFGPHVTDANLTTAGAKGAFGHSSSSDAWVYSINGVQSGGATQFDYAFALITA
jgi:hypothetical protein